MSTHIMTIDVEDWFHILGLDTTPETDAWAHLPAILPEGMDVILDLFRKHDAKATFFWLGWAAEKYPDYVQRCVDAGHEIGVHSYAHRMVHTMTPEAFRADLRRAIRVITEAGGVVPTAYRAPGFSITEQEPWAYEILLEEGIEIDSSVFPMAHGHGGQASSSLAPYGIACADQTLQEIPISLTTVLGRRLCMCGGGYFRLFPYPMIRYSFQQFERENRPGIVYMHPREFVPDHPRLPMSAVRRFKSYVNLDTVLPKMDRLMQEFSFTSIADYLRLQPAA